MKTLCLDSVRKYLVIDLYGNDRMICGTVNLSWRKQSETVFPEPIRLMKEAGWDSDGVDEVVTTGGPGSYTDVRIAVCVAGVLCTRKHIPLYTVSTLQLYAGVHERTFVMLDVRNQRAYTGALQGGKFVEEERILILGEIRLLPSQAGYQLFGDRELIDLKTKEPKFLESFIALRPFYRKVENVHTLTPHYLKEPGVYRVKL